MTKAEFLKLMSYPAEWLEWNMYPDELWEKQFQLYQKGDERGSEHDRNGAFHWWLKQDIASDQLQKLILLTFKDPDPIMAADVRRHIEARRDLPKQVRELLFAEQSHQGGADADGP